MSYSVTREGMVVVITYTGRLYVKNELMPVNRALELRDELNKALPPQPSPEQSETLADE